MARAKTPKPAKNASQSLSDTTAAATANMLRVAAEAGRRTSSAGDAEIIARLSNMCEEAANHMAQAQDVLFDGHEGGEAAIGHLDAALKCLRTLASEGEKHIAQRQDTPKKASVSA